MRPLASIDDVVARARDRWVAFTEARWNALIPKYAKCITIGDTHVHYLHPTKGWRFVSKRRLGLV